MFRLRYNTFLLLSLLFLLPSMAGAQQLIVQLKDADGLPAAKASLLLQHLSSGKTVAATVADEQGIAVMKADTGQYLLSAEYIGMEPVNHTVFLEAATADTFRITFRTRATTMETVVISSRKKQIESRDDKLIYNVESDSAARSRSVSQVLGNLPFVSVDGMGNVQVAGQTSFRVLVNGKETALFATSVAQALKSFPAGIVSRIELIMAPGARYDAEGVTAIINIITKKKFEGYKGFAIAYASDRSHFSNGLTLTGKTGRLGITLNGEANGSFSPLKGYTNTVTLPRYPTAYQRREVDGTSTVKKLAASGTIELNYEVDSLQNLIGYFALGKDATDNTLAQQTAMLLPDGDRQQGTITMDGRDHSPNMMAGLDYTRKGKSNPAKELTFRLNWRGTRNTLDNNTFQQLAAFTKWMENSSRARNDEFTLQLDAVPVAEKTYTIEAGTKAILRDAASSYRSLFRYDVYSDYAEDENNSNNFQYRQQVYAGYATANVKAGKNRLRMGLRLEQTHIKGTFSNLATPVTDQYLSFIPNLHWNRRIGGITTLSLSYNLNLLRPYITSLNPYVNNTDSFNISYGNPELGPQVIHKIMAQARLNTEDLFLTATITGHLSNNKILAYRLFDPATGVSIQTTGNAGDEKKIALGLSGNYTFSPAFRAGFTGDLSYVTISNRLQRSQKNAGYSGLAAGNFNWEPGGRFNLSGSGGVVVDDVTLLGRIDPKYFYQVNFGCHLIKDKLFATLNWNNVHSSYFSRQTRFSDDALQSVTTSKTVYRVIFFGIQYTFGKLRQEVARKKDIVNDDIVK